MNKEKEGKLAEISARITKVIDYLGETPNSFATKLGYPRAQTVYDIQKMKSAPSYDFFQRFSIAGYSAVIEIDWLLTGNGSMLKQNVSKGENTDNTLVSSSKDTQKNNINQEETSYIYKMYQEEREEKKKMLAEKDSKIDLLQSELRQQSAELAALKAKYPETAIEPSKGLGSSETAPNAHLHPHSPTSEHYHGSSLPPHQENQ